GRAAAKRTGSAAAMPAVRAKGTPGPTGGPAPASGQRSAAAETRVARAPTAKAAARRAGDGEAADAKRGWSPLAPFNAAAKASENLLVRMRKEKLATADEVIREIEKGPKGPRIVAAFDFDGTLVGGYTGVMLLQERIRRKEVNLAEIADTAGVTFKAMTRLLEANDVVSHSMAQWAGKTQEEMEELSAHLYENQIQDSVFPEMRRILAAHRAAGHTIVVATSASRYQVAPTVEALGIDQLLCTVVEVAEGKLTGKLVGDSLFGPGKVAAIERFVAENGSTLADTHFYADGDEEVGLMEAVGHPHPVNPGSKLAQTARARRWPVLRLESRGSTKPLHLVRSIGGMLSIMPILQAGVAVGLLTRNKRAMGNIVMPTWIAAQLSLAGVKLRVSGRRNLHVRRPAVFIFNHRNNFDGSFVAALVKTDYVAIAKKEMASNPIGKLTSLLLPTVFIDRDKSGAKSAAETLAPVVEAIDKGFSVMLAPEGTRVKGNLESVGEFKKGAFHIAMAGGIPLIPVVIRNALDVAAHSAGAMRPGTVDLAVLPPVPVDDWSLGTLDKHVAEVRQMFIDTLRDWPEPDDEDDE
ncbi:MAG: HAD-IB family hydrolase, partial [Novosphingobium sp.]